MESSDLDSILNTTLDDLKPIKQLEETGELLEIKHLGFPVDYHHNLDAALRHAKTSKDVTVYQYHGAKKQLVAGTEVSSPVRGHRPHIKKASE